MLKMSLTPFFDMPRQNIVVVGSDFYIFGNNFEF